MTVQLWDKYTSMLHITTSNTVTFLNKLILLVQPTTNHHHTTTILQPFFREHPGEPVPEKNFWTLWCKGRLTEADRTMNVRTITQQVILQCYDFWTNVHQCCTRHCKSPHYATFLNKFITAEKYKTAGVAGTATETHAQKSQAHFTQWCRRLGHRPREVDKVPLFKKILVRCCTGLHRMPSDFQNRFTEGPIST